MRIGISHRASWKVLYDLSVKDGDYLHARQSGVSLRSTYYRNTRRVRKILREAGIGWEQV